MIHRRQTLSRRNFLLTAGLGGAAAATAAIVATGPSSFRPAGKSKRATRGYHAGEHINNYYRTTKV